MGGDQRSFLQEVTGGRGTERVKNALRSCLGGEGICARSHVLEPALGGWLGEAWGRERPLLGKAPGHVSGGGEEPRVDTLGLRPPGNVRVWRTRPRSL